KDQVSPIIRTYGTEVRRHHWVAGVDITAIVAADDTALQNDAGPAGSADSASEGRLVGCDRTVAQSNSVSGRASEIDSATRKRGRIAGERTVLEKNAAAATVSTNCATLTGEVAGDGAAPHCHTAATLNMDAAAFAVDRIRNNGTLGKR